MHADHEPGHGLPEPEPVSTGPRRAEAAQAPVFVPVFVVEDTLFDAHRSRGYHPERPERLDAARRGVLRAAAEGVRIERLAARDATDEDLARVHDPGYLAALSRLDGAYAALDPDTYVAPASVAAARRAAGAAVALVSALLDREPPAQAGIALLRPPGHHATRDTGMGFCLLNNAAVAAAWALEHGASRVAVVDWDVHHGNGTQDIFWEEPRVLYVSLHQWPFYPGTGAADERGGGDARGTTVNVPLSGGATDAVYRRAFEAIVTPVLESFAPDLVVVSAGYDAHERDPLASMRLTEDAYAFMTRKLAGVARRCARGRIALLLEGGYDLSALEGSVAASVRALAGGPAAPAREAEAGAAAEPSPTHAAELERARRAAAASWTGL